MVYRCKNCLNLSQDQGLNLIQEAGVMLVVESGKINRLVKQGKSIK